jgi:hypothetical protein
LKGLRSGWVKIKLMGEEKKEITDKQRLDWLDMYVMSLKIGNDSHQVIGHWNTKDKTVREIADEFIKDVSISE